MEAGSKPVGFIFNRVPPRGLSYYDQRYTLAGYGPKPKTEKRDTPAPAKTASGVLPSPAAQPPATAEIPVRN